MLAGWRAPGNPTQELSTTQRKVDETEALLGQETLRLALMLPQEEEKEEGEMPMLGKKPMGWIPGREWRERLGLMVFVRVVC